MNWRRGILFALIHFAVAAPLVWQEELRMAPYLKSDAELMAEVQLHPELPTQNGEEVSFSPCGLWNHYSSRQTVLRSADLLAISFSGWEYDCPPGYSVAYKLGVREINNRKSLDRPIYLSFLVFVLVQWFLMGSFPLTKPKHWYLESTAFMTICTVIAGILVLIPRIDGLSRLFSLIVMLTFIVWFFQLFWVILKAIWKAIHFMWVRLRQAG